MKQAFRERGRRGGGQGGLARAPAGEDQGIYARIAREVLRPAAEEIRANPRAASAKLRWAVRA